MSHLDGPQRFQAATLRDRGLFLPFTTPLLVCSRVRRSERNGLELVVPKASRGRGHYVAPWHSIADLCQPGVFDTRLLARVGALPSLTAAAVREASLITAAEGFAGRSARAAALSASAADQEARVQTNAHLLLALVRSTDAQALPAGPVLPAQLAPAAKAAMRRLAARLGRDIERVAGGVAAIATALAPLGLGDRAGSARVPRVLDTIQALPLSLEALPPGTAWEQAVIQMIGRTCEITLACMASALIEARATAEDVPALVSAWVADPAGALAWLGRAELLADGWAWVCHLWPPDGPDAARRQALDEIALVLPALPREVLDWPGFCGERALPGRIGPRAAALYAEPPNLIDAAMRNEAILAKSA